MLKLYGTYWWAFVARGILAVLFGIAALLLPGITLHVLALLFAAFLIVDGIFSLAASVWGKSLDQRWWLLLLEGLMGIGIGAVALAWPGLTVLAIILFIGFWALFTGMLELTAAFSLRGETAAQWLLGLSGIISILFSLILFSSPEAGVVVMAWLIGLYAILFGMVLIVLGFRLRRHNLIFSVNL
ncbi:MAG: HdeD family acid-resistance protein [Desulfobulbaceae bacterium]|nr:HdeD family acid-resistance protein [Desulfobulbaceae bacterium]